VIGTGRTPRSLRTVLGERTSLSAYRAQQGPTTPATLSFGQRPLTPSFVFFMHQIYSQIPFAGPSSLANANGTASISPQETTLQSQQNQQQQQQLLLHQQQQQGQGPLVATGDWTKDLVHLAKTAELKYVVTRLDGFLMRHKCPSCRARFRLRDAMCSAPSPGPLSL
jgi:hypothetical protein